MCTTVCSAITILLRTRTFKWEKIGTELWRSPVFSFCLLRGRFCLVYTEESELSGDLSVFWKHTPSSCVPHETQWEATVLAFNFLCHSITCLPNISILLKIGEASDLQKKVHKSFLSCRLVNVTCLDLQIKIPNYVYLPLNIFKVLAQVTALQWWELH